MDLPAGAGIAFSFRCPKPKTAPSHPRSSQTESEMLPLGPSACSLGTRLLPQTGIKDPRLPFPPEVGTGIKTVQCF